MSLESRDLEAFKTISEEQGIKMDNPTVILVDKDPSEVISIDFKKDIIEFNPECLKQPRFEKMIRKGGLDRFLEYSILLEVLKHKIKDRKKTLLAVMRRYPEYLDMVGGVFGLSKRQLRLAQKRAREVGRWGGENPRKGSQ